MELRTEFEMMEFGLQEIKNGKHNEATSNGIPDVQCGYLKKGNDEMSNRICLEQREGERMSREGAETVSREDCIPDMCLSH